MLKLLKKLLPEGREHVLTPKNESAHFELRFGNLLVGRLQLEHGVWHFSYSDAFRAQSEVKPLVDFPDLDKHYHSEDLWPFFAVRIPSMEQPEIQREVRARNLDARNEVELLRAFGKTTIANPFVLDPTT